MCSSACTLAWLCESRILRSCSNFDSVIARACPRVGPAGKVGNVVLLIRLLAHWAVLRSSSACCYVDSFYSGSKALQWDGYVIVKSLRFPRQENADIHHTLARRISLLHWHPKRGYRATGYSGISIQIWSANIGRGEYRYDAMPSSNVPRVAQNLLNHFFSLLTKIEYYELQPSGLHLIQQPGGW